MCIFTILRLEDTESSHIKAAEGRFIEVVLLYYVFFNDFLLVWLADGHDGIFG
jgi:hypothetical protein